jgi:hypothetical protein
MNTKLFLVTLPLITVAAVGCSSKAGNVAVGAGAAGAAYEYSNKHQIEQLDKDYKEVNITKDEYDRRRKEIENRSLVY